MGSRRRRTIAGISRRGGVSGFEMTLVPSRGDPERYAIRSVREIDRPKALEALRTCSLAAAVLPGDLLAQGEKAAVGAGEASAEARIAFVRLAPRQVLSMFDVIRKGDAGVRELYSDLQEGGFGLMGDRARGSVIRAYAADGAARGEGIVMELPHKGADGTEAVFNVTIKGGTTGGGGIRADYAISTRPSRRSALKATRTRPLRN